MAIVASHIADDFSSLSRQALDQASLADAVELRLDRIGNPGEEALRELVGRLGRPVIVAVHDREAFGSWEGSTDDRLEILRTAARAGASRVDVDVRLAPELGSLPGGCRRILSRHFTEGTPDDLAGPLRELEALAGEGDLVKLVTRARSAQDGLRLLERVRAAQGSLIGFCAGERGRFTRVLAPVFGSPYTFAAPARPPSGPAPEPTAPGQIPLDELRALLPPGGPGPRTEVLAVVGDRVRHSLSPPVHGAALRAAGRDAVFVALETDDFDDLIARLGDPVFRGLAVTVPYKREAFAAARERDAASAACRASNTLVRDGDGWRASNTDVSAIRGALERGFERQGAGRGLRGAQVLILGAGGAARAAATAVLGTGARPLVSARRAEAGRELLAEIQGGEAGAVVEWERIGEVPCDALVHATPVGSPGCAGRAGDGMPLPAERVREGIVVLDAVYRPARTPLLAAARDRGCTCVEGAEWFVRQAAEQFEAFTGQRPDENVLRGAFQHAIERDD